MKTIVIIGGTRKAAYERLKQVAGNNGIKRREDFHEAHLDGHRLVAFGGSAEEVCLLRALGFGVEIVTVGDGISEEMQRRINHVRSANGGQCVQEIEAA